MCRSLLCLLLSCGSLAADTPAAPVGGKELRLGNLSAADLLPQEPLRPQAAACAYVLIGGFGDEVHGIMHSLAQRLRSMQTCPIAYYHWHAGRPDLPQQGIARIAGEIAAFRRLNPRADIVLIGHSLGASSALKLSRLLPREQGSVYLITLDPIDATCTPSRSDALTWWGNAYLTHPSSPYDPFLAIGGRWNACPEADVNLRFDGRQRDEHGRPYIHDHADTFLFSSIPTGRSLYSQLLHAMAQPGSKVAEQPQHPQAQPGQSQQ